MSLDRELIFSYVEEDNIQRAYFRVHPLLTPSGLAGEEAQKLWPCEGCLRIVPDRAEQHTFKDRMRRLGGWCVVDLAAFMPEANKIRTNKNFHPDRGEVNQYILYSDAVLSGLETVFYEVLDGAPEDAATLAERAITLCFYIRQGDTLFGPVKRAEPVRPETAAPCEAVLYTLNAPDGSTHEVLCNAAEAAERAAAMEARFAGAQAQIAAQAEAPAQKEKAPVQETAEKPKDEGEKAAGKPQTKPESKPAPAEKPAEKAAEEKKDAPLPIGVALDILDSSRTFEQTLSELNQPFEQTLNDMSQPASGGANLLNRGQRVQESREAPLKLSGTPLMGAQLATSKPQPKNKVQEVVSKQWREWHVTRNDPPAEPLPAGTKLHQVDNPVETACQALKTAWSMSSTHTQLIDCILSLDGVASKLEPRSSQGTADSALYHAIQRRLQELEAERLTALVQLDTARADVDAFRKQVLEEATAKTRGELTGLERDKAELEKATQTLREQIALLTAQRDELANRISELRSNAMPEAISRMLAESAMAVPAPGVSLRLSPISGEKATLEDMLARMEDVCQRSAVPYHRNRCIALLVAMAVSERIGLVSTAPAAAATMYLNFAACMGWQSSCAHQVSLEQHVQVCASPVDATPAVLLTALASYAPVPGVCKVFISRNASQTARNATYECDQWPMLPLGISRFVPEAELPAATPVSMASLKKLLDEKGATDEEVDQLLAPMLEMVPALSGRAMKEMRRFVCACAHLMDGGLSAACDWAIMMWILPAFERTQQHVEAAREILNAYPLSKSML